MRRCLLILLIACRKDEPQPREHQGAAAKPEKIVEKDDPCKKAEAEGPIAWIKDDYPAAQGCAAARKQPLVLDLWAPWCHTCLSMQSTVFTDPSFAADAKRFVFASLDTDREANAAVVDKFALSAWPTFYVIGTDQTVLARFVGGADLKQFHAFLDAGARAAGGSLTGDADVHLLAAERAMATKDHATADKELALALAAAPADWVRKPDALTSLILTKYKEKDIAGCLDLADKRMDDTGNEAAASDFLATAMTCGQAAPKDMADRVGKLRTRAIERWKKLLADPSATLSIDDRSDAMAGLREMLEQDGKVDEAKATADKQRQLLDDAAAKAPTPLAAMTYNWHRAEVYTYLGRGLDIVPALEKSAQDLPKEYDPRARLGWVYLQAKKYPEAAKWTDEALAMVYGPRKARLLTTRADIAHAMNDPAAEKKFRQAAVDLLTGLPAGQQSPDSLAAAKKALDAMSAPAPAPAPK